MSFVQLTHARLEWLSVSQSFGVELQGFLERSFSCIFLSTAKDVAT
ncbi:MAG: hypothetical protein CFH10_00844 [Alphaproteobacteria bacterium MarineAlpha4_Bin2]|nr:MAG: hypothetical protein CFH10_00844 [Alphaproteobacteria bacterium MarineAlpha4_Bin2]